MIGEGRAAEGRGGEGRGGVKYTHGYSESNKAKDTSDGCLNNILTLGVEVFDEVLEKVHSLLDFDFIHFQKVLGKERLVSGMEDKTTGT